MVICDNGGVPDAVQCTPQRLHRHRAANRAATRFEKNIMDVWLVYLLRPLRCKLRREVYDPLKDYGGYTIHGQEVNGKD